MAERERIGLARARTLDVKGALKVNGTAVSPNDGGTASITGSGTVTSVLKTITSVSATLGQDAALTGLFVTATWSGVTITLKVWKPTASGDCTPIAATAAKTVNWTAIGT